MSNPKKSRIRYTTRDLLLLTAFLAVYLAVFFRNLEQTSWDDIDGKLVGLLCGAIFAFFLLDYFRQSTIRERLADGIQLPIFPPWAALIFLAIVDATISTTLFTENDEIGVSGVALGCYLLLLRRPCAVAGKTGVVYGYGLWSWEKVVPVYDRFGELSALSLGARRWARLIVKVPPTLREPVEDLLREHVPQVCAPAGAARE